MVIETNCMPHRFWPEIHSRHPETQLSQLPLSFALCFGYSSFSQLCQKMPRWNSADMPLLVLREWGNTLQVAEVNLWMVNILALFWNKPAREVAYSLSCAEVTAGLSIGRILSGNITSSRAFPCTREQAVEGFYEDVMMVPPTDDMDFMIYLYRELITDWLTQYLKLGVHDELGRAAREYLLFSRQGTIPSGEKKVAQVHRRHYRN